MKGLFLLLTTSVCVSSSLGQFLLPIGNSLGQLGQFQFGNWLGQIQPILTSPIFVDPVRPVVVEENGDSTTCPCGTVTRRRIVGGKATDPNEYPWMLSMILTRSREHFCGASILTPNYALTAAHCTHGQTQPMSVLAGVHDRRRLGPSVQESRISQVIPHEEYSQSALGIYNDIAILVLATPLRFNMAVMPICMPVPPLNIENEEGKIIGWGKLGFNLPASQTLQEIDVEIQDKGSCRRTFPFFRGSTMHCTSNPTATACMGDSGGPLIWLDPEINRYTVTGLVSYGPTGCKPSSPVVLTDVSAYTSWIQSKVAGQQLCQKV